MIQQVNLYFHALLELYKSIIKAAVKVLQKNRLHSQKSKLISSFIQF